MVRYKKPPDPDKDTRSVKCALGSIIKEEYRLPLITFISEMSITATMICLLASLCFLFKVNQAVDDDNEDFFDQDGDKFISHCFYGVLNKNQNKEKFRDLTDFMRLVTNTLGALFQWPSNSRFHNAFEHLYNLYTTNVTNNLNTHCERRLKKFFKMRMFELNNMLLQVNPNADNLITKADVNNAVNYTYRLRDSTAGDIGAQQRLRWLLDELREMGAPDDMDIKNFTKHHWFKSLKMWVNIQRDIHHFHQAFEGLRQSWYYHRQAPDNVTRPLLPEPPHIKNFAAIPVCTFQRKHIKICTTVLYEILCGVKEIPKKCGATTKKGKVNEINITRNEFNSNKDGSWGLFFDLNKINSFVSNQKTFKHTILSDGVSCSILFEQPKVEADELSDAELATRYNSGEFTYELGIDPGMNTWNATVRRNILTKEECNMKMSSKKYHYHTKQNSRNAKADQMTRLFVFEEKADIANVAKAIGTMPSSKDTTWRHYIEHRLHMSTDGIKVYTQRKYARLQLDKHMEWHRAIDKIAGKLVGHKAAIVFVGAGGNDANSPIKIKKHVKCPGTRKLVNTFKKRANCVVRMVDEWMTSQHCGRCFTRFPQWTRPKRYKKCDNCHPDERLRLPEWIVTNVSKRLLQMNRTTVKMWQQMAEWGDAIAASLTGRKTGRLVSGKRRFRKTWQPNAVEAGTEEAAQPQKVLKTVWHRDISAAKLILYKGHCKMLGLPIHPALVRPPPPPRRIDIAPRPDSP